MTAVARDILGAEVEAIAEVLQGAATEEFERDTPLPGWNVRDVIAHCGSVLTRLRDQNLLGFTPEDNETDVVVRRDWSLDDVVNEYLEGLDGFLAMAEAAPVALDGLARGMWIHGGDIRAGLGRDDAYAGAGIEEVLNLIGETFAERDLPTIAADLGNGARNFGSGEPVATISCDPATFVRVVCGRSPDPDAYTLAGVAIDELRITG